MTEINKNTVLRWIIYFGAILVSYLIWHDIANNFKFPINKIMWCPGFGSVVRCNAISTGCKISIASASICFVASVLSTTMEGFLRNILNRFETGVCLSQLFLWIALFINIIKWMVHTGAIQAGEYEFAILFCYIIILFCLFYMAMLFSFTEMAYRDATED